MEVILLERVEKLGQMGDVVQVKNGYGRNFLLPQGKALRSNKANLARFESERVQIESRSLEMKTEAEAVAAKLNGQSFVVIRQASDSGNLFGSVTSRDIAEHADEGGFTISRGQIVLSKPVKELGLHEITVVLHPEVLATVSINVARSAEEAELQEQGKTLADMRAEDDAQDQFDVQELFDENAPEEEDEFAAAADEELKT